jgi:hypothetical protein
MILSYLKFQLYQDVPKVNAEVRLGAGCLHFQRKKRKAQKNKAYGFDEPENETRAVSSIHRKHFSNLNKHALSKHEFSPGAKEGERNMSKMHCAASNEFTSSTLH